MFKYLMGFNFPTPLFEEDGGADGGAGSDTTLTPEEEEFLRSLSGPETDNDDDPDDDGEPDDDDDDPDVESDDSNTVEEEPGGEVDDSDGNADDDTNDDGEPEDKSNNAFAKQRIQLRELNKQKAEYERVLAGFSEAFGIPADTSMEEQIQALQGSITRFQAQQNNIPVELMEKLNTLEMQNQSYIAQDLDYHNRKEADKLKDSFGLTDDEIEAFKDEMLQLPTGDANWNQGKIDWSLAYKDLHLDDIIARKVEAALNKETKRKQKVENQSNNPGGTQSKPSDKDIKDEDKKWKSVSDFEDFLEKELGS